ncbi:hypothetical protein VTG60DRAFT_6947 [Thermothelomyces hinnuleus]
MPSPSPSSPSGSTTPSVRITDDYGTTTAHDHTLPRIVVDPPKENLFKCGASSTAAAAIRER